LLTFHAELESEINDDVHSTGSSSGITHRETAFTRILAEQLEQAGILESHVTCFYEGGTGPSAMKANGYGVPDEERRLDLLISLYFGPSDQVSTINAAEIESAFRKLERYFKRALGGMHESLDASHDFHSMAERIHSLKGGIDRVSFILLTNARIAQRKERERRADVENVPASYEIWDLERYRRLCESGASYESLGIDLRGLPNGGLPAINVPTRGFQTWVTGFPGSLLADLYNEHGQRLLELNVRSYLQSKGKVNSGILDTLRKTPSDFMSYNNGITVVAEGVEFGPLKDGGYGILEIRGMQIVNGGQTTASIHRAMKDFGADLSDVCVQGKITVVAPERFQEIVPLISRFSNSQNKVSFSDLTANHQFHVGMQRVSLREWTPNQQSRWFYERTRGSYQTAKTREGITPTKRKDFERRNPPQQRFTKEDLAKFENAWQSLPHMVSRGAQKNFIHFMQLIGARPDGWEPSAEEYRRYVAKGILFRTVHSIVLRTASITAYQINVAAYTTSLLADRTARRIDLDRIWREQAVSDETVELIKSWAPVVFLRLPDVARREGKNTEESFKSPVCWDYIRQIDLQLTSGMISELVSSLGPDTESTTGAKDEKLSVVDHNNIAICKELSEAQWLTISRWTQGNLEEWQRGVARTLAGYAAESWKKQPSTKQAKHGSVMAQRARQAGIFDAD